MREGASEALVEVLDLSDSGRFRKQLQDLRVGSELPSRAEEVGYINWASTAPGIDWPERYWLARSTGSRDWLLWVETDAEGSMVGLDIYPACRISASADKRALARSGLTKYWGWLRDAEQDQFEVVVGGGLLSTDELERIAESVWST